VCGFVCGVSPPIGLQPAAGFAHDKLCINDLFLRFGFSAFEQIQELARRACLVLMDLLKGREPETKKQIVDTQLVVRKSCRRL